jgi:hypothetical protein
MTYLYTPEQRAQRREDIRSRLVRAAEVEAHRVARSITCAEATDHTTCVGHLPTNGQRCLCECHDQETP